MARQSGPIGVALDFQAFYPELKSRFPIQRLVDALASPEEPFLLDLPKFLKLVERSHDIELVESEDADSYQLRATRRDGERSVLRVVDLRIDPESGVILKAKIIRQNNQIVRLELLETGQLSDRWYQYDFHFPDRKVRRLAESR